MSSDTESRNSDPSSPAHGTSGEQTDTSMTENLEREYAPQADDSILGIITPAEPYDLVPTIVEPTPEQVTEALNAVQLASVEPGFDIEKLLRTKIRSSHNHAFFIVDLGILRGQVEKWRALLPRVEMFYGMKISIHNV